MSQPTGGLVLNPSQQIQLLHSPRGGRGTAISTKGIIDIIKLSIYRRKTVLYHKQMYGFSPYKPSHINNHKSDLRELGWDV